MDGARWQDTSTEFIGSYIFWTATQDIGGRIDELRLGQQQERTSDGRKARAAGHLTGASGEEVTRLAAITWTATVFPTGSDSRGVGTYGDPEAAMDAVEQWWQYWGRRGL